MSDSYKIYASKDYVDSKVLENIPVPTTASVGQTIVVKSVNENGKPTEWEVKNLDCVSYNEQTLTEEQKEQAQENIGIIAATDDDIIDLMLDMDMMPVVQDADGTILVDSDNTIILT